MVEREALDTNIALMAAHCVRAGLALRPHLKTHKCSRIARLQLAAGATGLCVAKLGEAEAMVDTGLGNILITSPIVSSPMVARLVALAERGQGIIGVVDTAEAGEALSAAARRRGITLSMLVDLDIGLHRTGVPPEGALALGQRLAGLSGLRMRGLQAYAGHLMHIEDAALRRERSLAGLAKLREVRDQFASAGLATEILTGGGTGTFDIDPEARVLTELQAGSYVFMDRQYQEVRLANGAEWPFRPSLFVVARVVSAHHDGHVTIDAGFKAVATDAGLPVVAAGAPKDASYFFFGDEQGGIALAPNAGERPRAGDIVRLLVPHCDPTVNLYDALHVFEAGRLAEIWPIEARGRLS
jgi:D-serine deaminase-like pyridoxal phosphate-dependent protein